MPSGKILKALIQCKPDLKINVVGSSASGKTTFSKKLADKLNSQHIEMDALFWKPDWQQPSDDEFFAILQQHLNLDNWVLDGNYTRTTGIKWQNVDIVIWLDYRFGRNLYQSVSRAVRRAISGKELWQDTNNVETLQKSFLSRDSIIWWMIKNYQKNRKKYLGMMQAQEFQHIQFIQLKSPKDARSFLKNL